MSKRKSQTAIATTSPRASSARRSSTTWRCSAGRPARRKRSSRSTRSSSGSTSTRSTRPARSSTASGSNGSTASGSAASTPTISSSGCGPSSRPSWPRADRSMPVRRGGARAAAAHQRAAADARRHRGPRRVPLGRRGRARPRDARPQALGRRHDRRRPDRRPRRDRRASARSRSRPTSSSRRCGRSPRRAAGRPATSSWPSGSP